MSVGAPFFQSCPCSPSVSRYALTWASPYRSDMFRNLPRLLQKAVWVCDTSTMAVRAGTHAQPAPSRGSLRALLERWGRDGDTVASLLESLADVGWFVLHG